MAYSYYLTIDKPKKERKKLNIVNSSKFQRLSNFKENRSTLLEIDYFTTKFKDEIELKKSLYEEGIIDEDDIMRKISIRMGEEIVPNGIFYSSDSKYLDEFYLRSIILSRQNDIYFLNKLCSHYRNSYCNNGTICYIRNMAETIQKHGKNDYVVKKLSLALDEFIIREIYDTDKKTGEAKLKYKSLHDLAMFVFRYIDVEQKRFEGYSEIQEKQDRMNELKSLKASIKNAIDNKKRVLKKNKQIEGQISLFDE